MNFWAFGLALISIIIFFFLYFKKREYLAAYVISIVIFLPKINIVSLSESASAGLRTDDLIICLFMVLTILVEKMRTYENAINSKFYKLFCLYLICSFISFNVGMITGYTYSISLSFFNIIRKIEYFCFIFVGYDVYFYHKGKTKEFIKRLLNIFIVYTLVISFFQIIRVFGTFRYGGYEKGAFYGRAVGFFNGPYELGAFFTITAIIYFYDFLKGNGNKYKNLIFAILSFILVFLSQSRSPLAITLLIFIIMIYIYCNRKIRIWCSAVLAAGVVLFLILVFKTNVPMLQRFRDLDLKSMAYSLKYYFVNRSYDEYIYTLNNVDLMENYVIQVGDISFNIRIFKWMALIDIILKFPLFGYGFGSNSVIDGNFIKLLAENGFIGTIIFVFVFVEIVVKLWRERGKADVIFAILSVFIGSVLIDLFEASKIMEFLWFFIGMANLTYQTSKPIRIDGVVYGKNLTCGISTQRWWCWNTTL